MGLYSRTKTNKDAEIGGRPFSYGENSKGKEIVFYIAREGGRNTRYQKVAEQLFKPYRKQIQHGTITPEVLEDALAKAYSQAIITGWENVEDENNEPLVYSTENAYKLLTDLPVLFEDIKDFARDYGNYLDAALKADSKN